MESLSMEKNNKIINRCLVLFALTLPFLIFQSANAAEKSNDSKKLPSFVDLLQPQFECNLSHPLSEKRRMKIRGPIYPLIYSVIGNFHEGEIRPYDKHGRPNRRFKGSYNGEGSLECGKSFNDTGKVSGVERPFVIRITEIKDEPGKYDDFLDYDEMKKQGLSTAEGETSFITLWRTDKDGERTDTVRPCLAKAEDLIAGKNVIDIEKLCKGHPPKDIEFTKKEIKNLIPLLKREMNSPRAE
jgi:hypothetical protein